MDGVIKRTKIYRYKTSGKLVALVSHGRGSLMVLSITDNLGTITNVANRKYVKSDLLESTPYTAEVRESSVTKTNGEYFSYHLVRVLTSSDLDLKKWENTASLQHLPVLSAAEFTAEEHHWSGARAGNIGSGIFLSVGVAGAVIAAATARDGGAVFFGLVAAVLGWFLIRHKWQASTAADPGKVSALKNHKTSLREQGSVRTQAALTSVEQSLFEKKNWDSLSPQQFEGALALRLRKFGFKTRTTQYSKDGGVDIHATDPAGRQTIIQVKKYAGNVGVAAVREMIGLREILPDRPHPIIYSLNGFSRDARALAAKAGVELRDIKSELLPMSSKPPF